jgi:DNA-binding MurR/RpiR family transcriptional regulator
MNENIENLKKEPVVIKHKLSTSGSKEELVDRIMHAPRVCVLGKLNREQRVARYMADSMDDLKEYAVHLGVSTRGSKDELVNRIMKAR